MPKQKQDLSKKLILEIDLNLLEKEWAEQAPLRRYWGRSLAKARKAAKLQDAQVDWLKAEISKEIRRFPKKFGFIKKDPTENALKEAVLTDKRYQRALRELIQLEFRVDCLQTDVSAIDHRKTALENEVDLWMGGYFATPRTSKQLTPEQMNELEDASRRTKSKNASRKIRQKER